MALWLQALQRTPVPRRNTEHAGKKNVLQAKAWFAGKV
jgi:hypothetical protein